MPKRLLMETTEASWEFQFKRGYSNSENPDKIISKKGMDYIEDIERDTHYTSVIHTRVQAVLGKGWNIKPHNDKKSGRILPRDQEIADFIRDQLGNIPTFETDIIAMFDSISKGFSLSEINYKKITSGRWEGKIGLKNIRKKQAKLFSFKFDKYGYYKPVQIDPFNVGELPLEKFIHFINGMDDENPYGESIGSKVAFWVWLKKNGAKFWAIYAERFGMPLGVVDVPENIGTDSPEYEKAQEVLDSMLKDSGIVKPKNLNTFLLEATRTGSADYDGFIKRCNAEISKIVLGQTLSTDEGVQGQGTHAQASVHAGVLNNYTLFDAIISSAAINYQLIRRLVDFNFVTEHYPIFEWKAFDIARLTVLAQNIRNLIETGFKVPAKFLYDEIGISIPEENEEILKIEKQENLNPNNPKPKGIDNKTRAYAEHFSEDIPDMEIIEKQNNLFLAENDKLINKFKENCAKIYEELANSIKGKKKVKPEDISKYITKKLTPELKTALLIGYLQGKHHAKQQIELSKNMIFVEDDEAIYEPINELLKRFLELEVITKAEFKILEKEMRRKAFTIAGVESEYLLKAIQNEIGTTIETGGSWEKLGEEINNILNKAGLTELSDHHLEVVIRNNVQEQYSESREELYNKLDKNEYPTKTVLPVRDNATRKSHLKLYGYTKPVDDKIWDKLKTPFAHNCRCIIVLNHKSREIPISNYEPDLTGKDFIFISEE